MKFKRLYYFVLSLMIAGFISCTGEDKKVDIPKESIFDDQQLEISQETMEQLIDNVSSPVEMAALIKEAGIPFSKEYVSNPDNAGNLNTNFEQSLRLGILGSDLGYLNMYDKTGMVINYISAIKTLADNLKVGQFFDFQTLKKLATNSTNLDSLMYLSVSSFNKMDSYLRENKRTNVSALIVTGVWIEGLYLATQVVKSNPNQKISERIGDQKNMLENIVIILGNFKKDKNFETLATELTELKEAYKDVKVSFEQGEPEQVEENGKLVIKQTSKSIVQISDEQVKKITEVTAKIRNKIVK
ncbi:MAG: hypothetical protein HY958_07135 [Bacteroidia bacterium]|nr:hypothetical protein [Bacteroidia bacterium]